MNPRWLERQTRLLLSWRERAREAAAGRQPGVSAEAGLAAAREAQSRLEALRVEAHAHVDGLAHRLERATAAQQRLVEAVQGGRLSPTRANRQNRRLSRDIQVLRERIAQCRRLIAADTAAAAGGFADLTLAQYATLARQPAYLRWSTMDPVDRRSVLLVCAMLVLCLAAGWGYLRSGREVVLGSSLNGSPPERVVLWCHNHRLEPVQLVLDPATLPPAGAGTAYWVELAVRGAGGPGFQALGGLVEARGRGDVSGADPTRVVVEPGLYLAEHFLLGEILPPGPRPEALRVRVLTGRGGVVYEGVHAWPPGG